MLCLKCVCYTMKKHATSHLEGMEINRGFYHRRKELFQAQSYDTNMFCGKTGEIQMDSNL